MEDLSKKTMQTDIKSFFLLQTNLFILHFVCSDDTNISRDPLKFVSPRFYCIQSNPLITNSRKCHQSGRYIEVVLWTRPLKNARKLANMSNNPSNDKSSIFTSWRDTCCLLTNKLNCACVEPAATGTMPAKKFFSDVFKISTRRDGFGSYQSHQTERTGSSVALAGEERSSKVWMSS